MTGTSTTSKRAYPEYGDMHPVDMPARRQRSTSIRANVIQSVAVTMSFAEMQTIMEIMKRVRNDLSYAEQSIVDDFTYEIETAIE